MRNLLLASVAVLSLGAASPVLAQSNSSADAAFGGGAGAAAGATAGFFLGGPIGAVIGGFTGAALGASAAVPKDTITYVETHPVQPVTVQGSLAVGDTLPASVEIYQIPSSPDFGYVYANGRAYIVKTSTREIVQSPGYVIPKKVVHYAQSNPTTSVTISGNVEPGYRVERSVKLGRVPDSAYSYVYINGEPALVDNSSRTVVWVGSGG